MFKMRQLLLQKKQKELSEYKAIGIIQDHLFLLYQAIQSTQEITKLLIRLFHLLEKNGRKSHRYEKKTVFDIMGVHYEYSIAREQKESCIILKIKLVRVYLVCEFLRIIHLLNSL
jgi:hypothetical protein